MVAHNISYVYANSFGLAFIGSNEYMEMADQEGNQVQEISQITKISKGMKQLNLLIYNLNTFEASGALP